MIKASNGRLHPQDRTGYAPPIHLQRAGQQEDQTVNRLF